MKHPTRILILALAFTMLPFGVYAFDLAKSEDGNAFLKFNGYIQPRLDIGINPDPKDAVMTPSATDQNVIDPAASTPAQPTVTNDFYIRRLFLAFHGAVAKNVNFFAGLFASNVGKAGNQATGGAANQFDVYPYDLFVEFYIKPELQIATGLLRHGFGHNTGISASTTHTIDGHAFQNNLTDTGIMFRGLGANKVIDYRVSIMDGIENGQGVNEMDIPRIVGRLGFNIFDAEESMWWSETYLGSKKILSMGVSYDLQFNASPTKTVNGAGDGFETESAIYGFAFDFMADIPFGENGLVALMNAYYFGPGNPNMAEGYGLWADLGYRIKVVEPLVAFDWYNAKDDDTKDKLGFQAGINYYITGHTVKLQSAFGAAQGKSKNAVTGKTDTKWGYTLNTMLQLKI